MGTTAELVLSLPGAAIAGKANDKRKKPEIPANIFMRRFCFIS
jgi:hypothetical protein